MIYHSNQTNKTNSSKQYVRIYIKARGTGMKKRFLSYKHKIYKLTKVIYIYNLG